MRSFHVHLSVLQGEEVLPHTCDWNLRMAVHALFSRAPLCSSGRRSVTSYLWLESEDGGACALFTCTSLFFREKKDRLQLMHFVFPANKKNTLLFRASKALSGDVCFKKSLS
jgi:hypothetical protein